MAAFVGKFKMCKTENFEEYMKALGVGMVMRKMAATANPTQEITLAGDVYTIKTTTTFKTTEINFKIGEPFDEETADGRKVKTTFVQNGDKLVQTQVGDKQTTTLTRDFSNADEMIMTLVVDDVTCIRSYKRE